MIKQRLFWVQAAALCVLMMSGCGADEQSTVDREGRSIDFAEWPIGTFMPVVTDDFKEDYLARFGGDSEEIRQEILAHMEELEEAWVEIRLTIESDGTFHVSRPVHYPNSRGPSISAQGRWILEGDALLLMVHSPSRRFDDPDSGVEIWDPLKMEADESAGTLRFTDESVWTIGPPLFERIG